MTGQRSKPILAGGITAAALAFSLSMGWSVVRHPLLLVAALAGMIVVFICLADRWLGIVLLLAAAPFYGFFRFVIELSPTQVLFKEFMIVLIMAGWLAEDIVIKRKQMPINRITPVLLGFLGVILVQFLRSPDPVQALFSVRVYVTYVPIFFVLLTEQPSDRQIKTAIVVMLISTALTLPYGLWQWSIGLERLNDLGLAKAGPNIAASGALRVFSTYAGPEYFGLNLVLQMLILSGLISALKSRQLRAVSFVLIAVMLLLLLLTLYRSLWIMATISFGTLMVITKRYYYIAILAVALIAILFFLPSYVRERVDISFGSGDVSYQTRRELYLKTNVIVITDNIIGYGLGSSVALESFQARTNRRTVFKILGGGATESWLASTAIELGLIGMAIYIWLLIAIIRQSVLVYRSGLPPLWQGLGAAFASFATGMLVISSFFMAPTLLPAGDLYFWFLAGIMVVLGQRAQEAIVPTA